MTEHCEVVRHSASVKRWTIRSQHNDIIELVVEHGAGTVDVIDLWGTGEATTMGDRIRRLHPGLTKALIDSLCEAADWARDPNNHHETSDQ